MLKKYFGRDRFYHNITHIADCLIHLHEFLASDQYVITYPEELIQAVLWHDVVYNPTSKINEEMSAAKAVEANPHLNGDVLFKIIMATKHVYSSYLSIEEQIMADLDLRSLSLPESIFDDNTKAIRAEYASITDGQWAKGRIEFCVSMLKRPQIYYTILYFSRYEAAARNNLKRTIAALSQ